MKCPTKVVQYMHEYLDEELSAEKEKILREYLQKCPDCQTHLHELKKSIALVQSTSNVQAPSGFTANVMKKLPKEKKKIGIQRWFRHHPFLTAAALFIILMGGSIFSIWNEDQQFSVSKQPNLIVENDIVIVPEGEVIKGDIVVRNGTLKIEGEVQGNVTIINGEKYLASAGNVSGEIKEVNELFDWVWYNIKKTAKDVVNVFDKNKEQELD
ncbi:anti-sigma factor [Bacillus aquiflavi]|uniref:Anti-sigma factor n=1 Tax=Bacillus aquiflavi TaxID=2672567 RepID=A0A6B3VXS6_9BACI|nr:anti-sigma factor [Bacillus aquiflavi]MBA4537842.1 anti-sigma factor [Bacillus aquiflavi]NEY82098.1 anti-sigma factor [Bacillus aquiflavi]